MAQYGVSIDREKDLRKMMRRLGIYEKDLDESFIRSSGRGGQNVNKVATCVALVHKPSGIMVKCHRERTQGLNRFYARCQLIKKLELQQRKEIRDQIASLEKSFRQERRRSTGGKERMLQDKHHHSEIKQGRKKLKVQDVDELS